MGDEMYRVMGLKSQCLRRIEIYVRGLKVNAEMSDSPDSRGDAENWPFENIDINSSLRDSYQHEPSSSNWSSQESIFFHEDFQNCGDLIHELKETEVQYVKILKENIDACKLMVTYHECREILEEADKIRAFMDKLLSLQTKFASHLSKARSLSQVLELFIQGVGLSLLLTYKDFFMSDKKYNSLTIETGAPQDVNKKENGVGALLLNRLLHYKEIFDSLSKKIPSADDISEEVKTSLLNISTVLQQRNKKLELEKITSTPLYKRNMSPQDVLAAQTLMIDHCPLDPDNKYGNYVMKDSFIMNYESLKESVTLHLFSKVIFITRKLGGGRNHYRAHLDLSYDITLGPEHRNKKILLLEDRPRGLTYTFEAELEQIQIYWRSKIHELLWEQMEAAKLRLRFRRHVSK